jgi:hypothetical protein
MLVFYYIPFVEQQTDFIRYIITVTVEIFGCGLGKFELKADNLDEERGLSAV